MCKFLTADILKSKASNWGNAIASMSHITFEYIKDTDNILADSISYLRSVHFHSSLDLEGEGTGFGYDIFEDLPSLNTDTAAQEGKNV